VDDEYAVILFVGIIPAEVTGASERWINRLRSLNPVDDVYLLIIQFPTIAWMRTPFKSHTGAYGINAFIVRSTAILVRSPGSRYILWTSDNAIENFGDFQFEQTPAQTQGRRG